MPVAINENGEALRLDKSGQWVPTRKAENPQTGETLLFDGQNWLGVKEKEPDGAVVAGGIPPEGVVVATVQRKAMGCVSRNIIIPEVVIRGIPRDPSVNSHAKEIAGRCHSEHAGRGHSFKSDA